MDIANEGEHLQIRDAYAKTKKVCIFSMNVLYLYMRQLALPFYHDENFLKLFLEKAANKNISIVITDNSTSMVSIKIEGKSVSIRLHRIFLSAENNVLNEIADFIKNRKKKTPLIRNFINQHNHCLKKRPPRRVHVQSQGTYYNLLDIYNSLNKKYFEERITASITWGTKRPKRAAARRTLGSYSSHSSMIRINPLLDSKNVPRYFLEFIVYHEMLHADMDMKTDTGRRSLHSKAFRKHEKQFQHYEKALAWEKKRW